MKKATHTQKNKHEPLSEYRLSPQKQLKSLNWVPGIEAWYSCTIWGQASSSSRIKELIRTHGSFPLVLIGFGFGPRNEFCHPVLFMCSCSQMLNSVLKAMPKKGHYRIQLKAKTHPVPLSVFLSITVTGHGVLDVILFHILLTLFL